MSLLYPLISAQETIKIHASSLGHDAVADALSVVAQGLSELVQLLTLVRAPSSYPMPVACPRCSTDTPRRRILVSP